MHRVAIRPARGIDIPEQKCVALCATVHAGYTITSSEAAKVKNEEDFLDLLELAITRET